MATTGRISRVENIPSVHSMVQNFGPWTAADAVNGQVTICGFAHRDLIVDDVLRTLGNDANAADVVAELVYHSVSDWEGDVAATIETTTDGSRTYSTGDWTDTGIIVAVGDAIVLGSTDRDLRTDGDAVVIPAGSWYGWHFSGNATTGLSGLVISMRCREVNL